MKVTKDEYELPLAVATSVNELARITGANYRTVASCLTHAQKKGYKSAYKRIWVDDDEEE